MTLRSRNKFKEMKNTLKTRGFRRVRWFRGTCMILIRARFWMMWCIALSHLMRVLLIERIRGMFIKKRPISIKRDQDSLEDVKRDLCSSKRYLHSSTETKIHWKVSKETYVYQKETYIHQPRPSNDVVNSAARFDASAARSKINNERFDLPHRTSSKPCEVAQYPQQKHT